MKYVAKVLSMLLICAVPVIAQESSPSTEKRSFEAVERIGDPGYRSFFMFSTDGRGYTIRADGYAESGTGKERPRNFSLPSGRKGHMVRLYYLVYENDLLLICRYHRHCHMGIGLPQPRRQIQAVRSRHVEIH